VELRRICVFAGSSLGAREVYASAAEELGREIARRHMGLVYGGASRGLMSVVADAALAEGGEVIGVLPRGLFSREVAHTRLTELREVGSMHERKALMSDLADGFVALPGGFGTFDELFEIVTWAQIGLHRKPIGLLDVDGYYGPLLQLAAHAETEGFVPSGNSDLLLRHSDPAALLDALATSRTPRAPEMARPAVER